MLQVMAVYVFQSDDGETVERVFPMRSAPELGYAISVQGKMFRRILTPPTNGSAYDRDKFPKLSSALPQFCEGAEHVQSGVHVGKPIITSRRHQDELCRMHGYTREYES